MSTLTERLTEIESARVRAESSLHEELAKATEALQTNSSVKELAENLGGRVRDLEGQLSKTQDLLTTRDAELEKRGSEMSDLTERLIEMESVKQRAESSLREEVRRTREALQIRDSAIQELERHLSEKIEALEIRLAEKEKLLKTRDGELEARRSEVGALTERLRESAKERTERVLQQELVKGKGLVPPTEFALKQLEKKLGGKIHTLESQLGEKQELLKERDKQIEKLSLALKEMKLVFAKGDKALYQSIARRNVWRRRLARLGIPIKMN